ncbi:MAG TPA: hypothetical protein EYP98_15145 [Planctomycetes bacterium]|nr:hypothetical protein [Planctomycetota bacterium]
MFLAGVYLSRGERRRLANASRELDKQPSSNPGGQARRLMLEKLLVLGGGEHAQSRSIVISTGKTMADQYEPWYFGVAFAFCFKYCTGMPDAPEWMKKPRYRRAEDAPRVEFPLWVKLMTRRIEQQLKRDWLLGFSMGSFLFRSTLNACRTMYSYTSVKREGGHKGFTPKELEEGAVSIVNALGGKYKDQQGKTQPVAGDFQKVKNVTSLTPAARRLLQNLEHATRTIPGTQEVRKIMRYDTHAGRIRRGVPIFITFSPDEKHNMLMLRLSRCRRKDPVNLVDPLSRRFGGRLEPELGTDFVELKIPLADLVERVPLYDDRRAILARDPLASVDGFRVLCSLAYEYLFGMRVCAFCPDCNNGDSEGVLPCQDLFGSNATPEGGVFGRADGGITSIEAQKSAGSLHAHSQLHVQCIHQHKPLREIFKEITGGNRSLVEKYLLYKSHVCRQEYADLAGWQGRQQQREEAWPEYADSLELVSTPAYLSARLTASPGELGGTSSGGGGSSAQARPQASAERVVAEGRKWRREYLFEHVQRVQEMKQNHVHTLNDKGERVPLTHCRRPDNPKLCKGDFPRTLWLSSEPVVLCRGLLRKMDMASSGRRNKLGALHGPMNEASVNGSHPALLAAPCGGACNSDVQLPYRLPICEATHAAGCEQDCLQREDGGHSGSRAARARRPGGLRVRLQQQARGPSIQRDQRVQERAPGSRRADRDRAARVHRQAPRHAPVFRCIRQGCRQVQPRAREPERVREGQ